MAVQKNSPQFRDNGGQGEFSIALYESYLNAPSTDKAAFLQESKDLAVLTHYQNLLESSVAYPANMLDLLERNITQQRSFSYVKLDSSSAESIQPGLVAIRDYYKANQDKYFWPQTRDLSFISFSAADLVDRFEVSDEEIAQEFDRRKQGLARPEYRNLSQVNFRDDQAQAQSFAASVQEQGWDEAVKALPEGFEALDLGRMSKNDAEPAFVEHAFSLEKAGSSAAFESDFGWLVVNVEAITPAYEPILQIEGPNIAAALKLARAQDAIFALSQDLDYAIGDGKTLEQASADLNLPFAQEKQINASGVDKQGQDSALRFNPAMLDEAFAENVTVGKAGFVLDDKNGTYFVVRVDAITEQQPKGFNDARDQATRDLKRELIAAAKDALVDQALAQLDAGETMQTLAEQHGTELVEIAKQDRFDFARSGEVYARSYEQFFQAEQGKPFWFENLGERFVVSLNEIDYQATSEQTAQFIAVQRQQFSASLVQDVSRMLSEGIAKKYDYQLNKVYLAEVVDDVADQLALK